jgi:hypothetical protein
VTTERWRRVECELSADGISACVRECRVCVTLRTVLGGCAGLSSLFILVRYGTLFIYCNIIIPTKIYIQPYDSIEYIYIACTVINTHTFRIPIHFELVPTLNSISHSTYKRLNEK